MKEGGFILFDHVPCVTAADTVSLFLDFDGTVVEIASEPQKILVTQELIELLTVCRDTLQGRFALVSGRPVHELQQFLGTGFKIVGSHGLEYLLDDDIIRPDPPAQLQQAVERMRLWAHDHTGVLLEQKPLGAALHYRSVPDLADACMSFVQGLAQQYDLHLQSGSMVAELRAHGGDKGLAIKRLMALPLMAGTAPIFIGDDTTDEPAFLETNSLGGIAILVGPPRQTNACYNLPDPAAVKAWLQREIVRQ